MSFINTRGCCNKGEKGKESIYDERISSFAGWKVNENLAEPERDAKADRVESKEKKMGRLGRKIEKDP